MIIEADPRKIQQLIKQGLQRTKTYRNARAKFINEFAGQYFKEWKGLVGNQPINLLFSTVRAYIPNLVMKNPLNEVTTKVVKFKPFAEMLSKALDDLHEQIKLKKILRAWIVDAIFGIGICETGLAVSDNLVGLDDVDVDLGQIFTQIIDLDDFILDPHCTALDRAMFLGHIVRTPRSYLYEISDLDRGLIDRLPAALPNQPEKQERVESLSKRNIDGSYTQDVTDLVDVAKVWVPEANAIIYTPDPRVATFDKFIGVKDFYGPAEGPYSFLALTPPVPNNPLPVAPIGIWRDLSNMANRVFKKLMAQVDRQKDIIFYRPQLADVMQDVLEAEDSDVIACDDPAGIVKVSMGGQNRDNVEMAAQLQIWYNYIAGNPEQMAGIQQRSRTATQAQIMQANANVTINDMRDIIYDETAEISKKHAWYLYTDPLIQMPLTKRTTGGEEIQLWLTPEQQQADFFSFNFKIKQRSLQQLDPQIRSKRIMEFVTNAVPAATMTAQMCMQMGIPFNLQKYITELAEELGIIDFISDIFYDPEFQERLEIMMKLGPQNPGKAQMMNPNAVFQQEGYPGKRQIATPQQEFNKNTQETAATGQSAFVTGVY